MNVSEVNKFTDGSGLRTLRGEMRMNELMRKHTSWRVGGEAARFYRPADLNDLSDFLQNLPEDEPVYVVGLGSNLLVRDGGLKGSILALHARLNDLQLVEQNKLDGLIYVGAGVACAKVARFTALHDLAGAEFLAGIPGTIGGALAMNAGCYGTETWEIAERVRVIDRMGQLHERHRNDYEISYRQVTVKPASARFHHEEWFVGGWFRLKRGNHVTSIQKIKALLLARVSSQPLNLPNAGSVFRNPPSDYAARLIESCDLKGFTVGGAMVSPKHANFIVNTGGAIAADIETIIGIIKDTVKNKTGVALVQEVRIIGAARRYS
ncbi:MAG: UDP-N-acetylmuramate dehydrogenase [Nitrosomonas sp.]|nr:UDP-N-acetylmuramate dehydrogenase [Nitrosomonas sp.]MDP1949640.1 UDP-N-acetylmuramate dehydrogenase [Nitrosomonas sp.]